MKEDLQLVEDVLKGNVDAFEDIIERYEMGIANFIYSIIKDKTTTEDLTQEVFIVVYKKLYTFKNEYKLSTWIYKIARNKAIDYLRKRTRNNEVYIQDVCVTSREMSPESFAEFRETKTFIQQFINTLNDIDKEILTLRYCKDTLTFKEIAEVVDMGESAVKKRYYKIYEKYERFIEGKNSCLQKISSNL